MAKQTASSILWITLLMVFTAVVSAQTDTMRPLVVAVEPGNNALNVAGDTNIVVQFSEPMNPATLNDESVILLQRTSTGDDAYRTIELEKEIAYSGNTLSISPNNDLAPSQEFGNVFTVVITADAQDIAGNALAEDYVWSFSTSQSMFNNDQTTAQIDQRTVQAVNEDTLTPIPFVPSTFTSTPFIWALGALLVLLIALIFFVFAMKPSEAAQEHQFGQVHPIIDIEGIGPEYASQLNAVKIWNTKQLWEANAADVSSKTGISQKLIESWQHMAELSSVKDIGPQYAELLERSGVHSISQLKSYDTRTLLKLVRQKQNSLKTKIQGHPPGRALVEHWIDEARHKSGE